MTTFALALIRQKLHLPAASAKALQDLLLTCSNVYPVSPLVHGDTRNKHRCHLQPLHGVRQHRDHTCARCTAAAGWADRVCVAGIIRRVLLLILVGVTSGTALFFLGLKFAFPEYR